mmetsp:Transcript_141811/g.247225  ORF Transcript_141811/g.247225 Transcript_141811/m.247225 type:complete len:97 (+) Transcript_141811:337-627(+)
MPHTGTPPDVNSGNTFPSPGPVNFSDLGAGHYLESELGFAANARQQTLTPAAATELHIQRQLSAGTPLGRIKIGLGRGGGGQRGSTDARGRWILRY